MCVIIAKNKGIALPDEETLKSCWNSNIDGAGFSVTEKNKVVIHKGFMDFESFYNAVSKFGIEDAIVVHFRRTTQGGAVPELTHPFFVPNLECAICHNGDIPLTSTIEYKKNYPNESDTSMFVKKFVPKIITKIEDFEDKDKMELIKFLIGEQSKMAIHTVGGIKIVGWFHKEDGLYYSNFTNAVVFKEFTKI